MKTIQITLDDDLHASLKQEALHDKISLGNLLREILKAHTNHTPRTPHNLSWKKSQ